MMSRRVIRIVPVVLIVIGIFVLAEMGPSSTDIRVDCGDLRFRYLGVPLSYEYMPEPQRSVLLNNSAHIAKPWVSLGSGGKPGSKTYKDAAIWRIYFYQDTAWASVDRGLLNEILNDVRALLLKKTPSGKQSNMALSLISDPDIVDTDKNIIKSDWEKSPIVKEYISIHNKLHPDARETTPLTAGGGVKRLMRTLTFG
jgi:hypothetical protein